MDGLPVEKHYNLTHFQQKSNWDCGLTCIIMVLSSAKRDQFLRNFDKICTEEGFGSSTWTIDLCYLLQRFQVKNEYFTKTLGIDPNYNQHAYYSQIIDKDEKRVTLRFKEARAHGITVEQRTIDVDEIIYHLAHHGPVILLTNASLLTCEICKPNTLEKFGYAGHYVVLCGYNLKTRKFYYHNPEVHDGHVCLCSTASIDLARKAFGTDEDIILIYEN